MHSSPIPDNLARAFFTWTRTPSQAQIDWLVHRHGVPPLGLGFDGDGGGWAIGSAKVERVGRRFEFQPEDGAEALVVVARDEIGNALDLVAWSPRAGWAAPWLGDAGLLGLQDLLSQRFVDPLQVHRDVLGWMQSGRNGVVILNPSAARRHLTGYTLQAESVDHGLALRHMLEGPAPRIVVPANIPEQVAA